MNIRKMLPAFAIAIGLALAMATSGFKEVPKNKNGDQLFTFQYNPPGGTDYSTTSVQNVTKWSYTTDNNDCSNNDIEACKVRVPVTYVNNPTGSPSLKSSVNLTATESSAGISYVSATAAGMSGSISNKN